MPHETANSLDPGETPPPVPPIVAPIAPPIAPPVPLAYARAGSANGFVKVATYTEPIEAELARNKLEAEGIFVSLGGEELQGGVGSYGLAFRRLDLLVSEDDVERATQILDRVNAIRAARVAADRAPAASACPACGSANVHRRLSRAWMGLAIAVAGALLSPTLGPAPVLGGLVVGSILLWTADRTNWKCDDCGHRWLPEQSRVEPEDED